MVYPYKLGEISISLCRTAYTLSILIRGHCLSGNKSFKSISYTFLGLIARNLQCCRHSESFNWVGCCETCPSLPIVKLILLSIGSLSCTVPFFITHSFVSYSNCYFYSIAYMRWTVKFTFLFWTLGANKS